MRVASRMISLSATAGVLAGVLLAVVVVVVDDEEDANRWPVHATRACTHVFSTSEIRNLRSEVRDPRSRNLLFDRVEIREIGMITKARDPIELL